MTDPRPRGRRWVPVVIIVALVALIAIVVALALTANGKPTSSASSTAPVASAPTTSAPVTTVKPTATAEPVPTGKPTPQPTKTAAISQPTAQPIRKKFTARVAKVEAVTGKAEGPGEIGGPSVRFTIRIENTTGKTVSLSDTVVNAYYGKDATPAVSLRLPGGKNFPASVKDGGVATGVYLFNIPKKDRGRVLVTVDTSVRNPVVAFQGSAPKR